MQSGDIVFTKMDRVVFGKPAGEALLAQADRLGARRVFLLVSRTLNRETSVVSAVTEALGDRFAGLSDQSELG